MTGVGLNQPGAWLTSLQQAHSFQSTNSKEHTQEEEGIRHLQGKEWFFSDDFFVSGGFRNEKKIGPKVRCLGVYQK